jgi:hypothetical protein
LAEVAIKSQRGVGKEKVLDRDDAFEVEQQQKAKVLGNVVKFHKECVRAIGGGAGEET